MQDSTPGFSTVPNWMLTDDDVSAHMILVYVALNSWTIREPTAYPSVSSIAARAKISPSSVKRALRDLEALGLVETFGRARETGGQTSNLYRIHSTPPVGQSDRGGRSEGPGAPVSVTYEEEPQEETPLADARGNDGVRASATSPKRATRIPDPFIVTAEMWAWAAEQGYEREWVRDHTVRFVDYWRAASGQSARKMDWTATWRNWLRKEADARPQARPGGPGRETPDERMRRLMALADEMDDTYRQRGSLAGELGA